MSVSNPISSLMGFNASPVVQFRLPDTVHNWPWPRRLNPHYLECKAESQSWCEAFNAFSPKAQTAFNRCDFSQSLLRYSFILTLKYSHCFCSKTFWHRWPIRYITRVCVSFILRDDCSKLEYLQPGYASAVTS